MFLAKEAVRYKSTVLISAMQLLHNLTQQTNTCTHTCARVQQIEHGFIKAPCCPGKILQLHKTAHKNAQVHKNTHRHEHSTTQTTKHMSTELPKCVILI